jgi:outer membrane protein
MFKMKNVIKSVVLVIACLVATGSKSIAQSKLGHINASLLITMMPEAKDADKKIQDFYTALQDQMKTMQTEFQTKYADFQKTEKALSDASKTVKGAGYLKTTRAYAACYQQSNCSN